MDLLKSNVNKIFFKYLFAAIGSALITSIYSIVDCIMVGQYEGPDGTSALAVVMPIWNMMFAFALLFGLGGSVLMSNLRGKGMHRQGNAMFTSSFICVCAITAIMLPIFIVFDAPLLKLFGAGDNQHVLALSRDYAFWLKFAMPLFTIGQALAVFIRNDNNPSLAMAAVLSGGIFNIFGDYIFVFVADMGASGAGLATSIGQFIAVCVLLTHFLRKKNTLRFVRPERFFRSVETMIKVGCPTFVIDMAAALSSTLFNNQIREYCGFAALAVFGVIINVAMMVQSFSSGIGQAIQPIVSVNYGAENHQRVKSFFLRGLGTVGVFTAVIVALCMLLPKELIYAFMTPTEEVLASGPSYMRAYFVAFVFMIYNIFSMYYLQAVMRSWLSVAVSVLRSLILGGGLVLLLPPLLGADIVWWVMPIAEGVTAVFATTILLLTFFGPLKTAHKQGEGLQTVAEKEAGTSAEEVEPSAETDEV